MLNNGNRFSAQGTSATAVPRFKKAGVNAFSADITIGGRLTYQSTYTGSADGKMLTETGSAVGTTEKYKAVYDRQ